MDKELLEKLERIAHALEDIEMIFLDYQPTLNEMRAKYGLGPIPEGYTAFTRVKPYKCSASEPSDR